MQEAQRGVLAIAAASAIWGLSALYWKLLAHVPPLEVLAHRTLWSVIFFAAILAVQGRLATLAALFARPSVLLVAAAGLCVSANWFAYILAIQIDRAMDSSLGYFIFPLVAVALGALVLGERHGRAKWAAVALSGAAVVVLALGYGRAPWLALVIAATFGIYGLVKRRIAAGPVASVTAEIGLLVPLAAAWLAGVHLAGWQGPGSSAGQPPGAFGRDWADSLLLAASGPMTALPLMLFSYAARRVRYATLGLVQYLNPTLQLLVAALVFREAFGPWQAAAFAMIWAALALYSLATLREERRAAMPPPPAGP